MVQTRDGKLFLATFGWTEAVQEALKNFESRVVVADVDGGNAKVMREEKGKVLTGVDWR